MEIIIPCAGLSSRFPGLRPKYLLTDYSGKMMIEQASKNFIGKYPVSIVILKKHDEEYNAQFRLREVFGNLVNIIVLEEPTLGPADTVYQAITTNGIKGPFLIKDSDGFYDSTIVNGNIIYVCNLNENPNIKNVHAKSYTITNDQGIINSVIEKQIVSNNFCAGGYQFESAAEYCDIFLKIKSSSNKEIFVSNIVDYMINNGSIFIEQKVHNFIDVGTASEWFEYNNKPTYFCDIDGTIIKNKHPEDPNVEILQNNTGILLKEISRGCKIVFCTARPKKFEHITRKLLNELGFTNYELIMEVNHSKRILINDFAQSNPYPSAEAINLKRNSDTLPEYIKNTK